jgi:methionyl-tRNA formyltransferase
MTRVALFTSQDVGYTVVKHFASKVDLLVLSYDVARYDAYGYRSALAYCREHRIKHVEAPKADQRVMDALVAHKPDIIVCCWYDKILPVEMLGTAHLGGINVHPGKLPYYKGRWPTPWYILNGDPTYGIAVHKMVAEVDAGDIYLQREYPIQPNMTGHELLREAMLRSAQAIIDCFDGIVSGELKPVPQAPGGSRYDHLDKTYIVDWNQPAEIINRHVRVHARPYEPARALVDGKWVHINRASVLPHVSERPGTLVSPLVVACSEGALAIEEMQSCEVPPSRNI